MSPALTATRRFQRLAVGLVAAATAACGEAPSVDEVVIGRLPRLDVVATLRDAGGHQVQWLTLPGPATEDAVRGALLRQHERAVADAEGPRRGVYLYAYRSEADARRGHGDWVARLARDAVTGPEPEVVVLASRLHPPPRRFGLTETERRHVFLDLEQARVRAQREAAMQAGSSQRRIQSVIEVQLRSEYHTPVAQRHGLTGRSWD